jgi:hypothetical protein
MARVGRRGFCAKAVSGLFSRGEDRGFSPFTFSGALQRINFQIPTRLMKGRNASGLYIGAFWPCRQTVKKWPGEAVPTGQEMSLNSFDKNRMNPFFA